MTKFEWERQLKKGISGLPKTEQQRVLDYYNELFADKIDAGLREQYIISEFGNPYDVANKILVDYYNEGKDNPAVDEYIYSSSDEIDVAFDDAPEAPAVVEAPKRKTFAERREERHEEQKARHEVRREEHIDDTFSDGNESDTNGDKSKRSKGARSASGLIAVLCVLVYFVVGACFNMWHPTWLIFLLMPCIITLIEAIHKRNWHIFAYPVFVTFLYLLMGFYAHNWHPGWVLFVTIPVYYVLGAFISKNTNGSKSGKSDKKARNAKAQQEPVTEPQCEENTNGSKDNKSDKATSVVGIIARVLMTICLVWVMVVVWSFVIGLLCGGVGMIVSGAISLVGMATSGLDALVIGLCLAQIGLGLICAFGMAALIKPCINMCKTFGKTIKNSFNGKEKA